VSSLKEGANTLPESSSTSEEYGTAVGGRHESPEPEPTTEQKIRKSLICRTQFPSAWSGLVSASAGGASPPRRGGAERSDDRSK